MKNMTKQDRERKKAFEETLKTDEDFLKAVRCVIMHTKWDRHKVVGLLQQLQIELLLRDANNAIRENEKIDISKEG